MDVSPVPVTLSPVGGSRGGTPLAILSTMALTAFIWLPFCVA